GLTATPTFAGNIALTGHDDDLHCTFGGGGACTQLQTFPTFVRAGSPNPSLPVLAFDDRSLELDAALTSFGITHTTVNPDVASNVTDALFDPTKYSAFVVASDITCGGCDIDTIGEAAIAAHTAAIDSFFNAGGGIIGLSGASNAGTYYNF